MSVLIIFIDRDGSEQQVCAQPGASLLQVAQENGIDIEGACEGNMACSTCHLIVDASWYEELPAPSSDEDDMLDLAVGLTATSRLGCQIRVTESMDGLKVRLPAVSQNMLGF